MEQKPDQSYVLSNLDLVDCLLRGGAEKGHWDHIDPNTLARGTLETHSNGVVLRIWFRPARAGLPSSPRDERDGAGVLRERTKEEAAEQMASVEKTLLGTGPAAKPECCHECALEGVTTAVPEDGVLWSNGWKVFNGKAACPMHAEKAIQAAHRERNAEEMGRGLHETPESLRVLLECVLPEGDHPPLSKIREWHSDPGGPGVFRSIAAWARLEHAWAAPIKGKEPPERLAMPDELAAWISGPRETTKKRAKKAAAQKKKTRPRPNTDEGEKQENEG